MSLCQTPPPHRLERGPGRRWDLTFILVVMLPSTNFLLRFSAHSSIAEAVVVWSNLELLNPVCLSRFVGLVPLTDLEGNGIGAPEPSLSMRRKLSWLAFFGDGSAVVLVLIGTS